MSVQVKGRSRPLVLLSLGTRPEAIKLLPVVLEMHRHGAVETRLVTTGQHRDLVRQILDAFGITPDLDLDTMRPGQTLNDIVAGIMPRIERLYDELAPDMVVVQGDTTSAFVGALAAFHRQIPVAHVEAGLRSGDRHHPYPEEANRRMIGAVADLHLAPTAWAADNLRREGVPEADVVITGNTTVDALLAVLAHPELERLGALPGDPLPADREVVLITLHRRESWLQGTGQSGPGSALEDIVGALASAARRHPERLFVYPVHPNPRVREPAERVLGTVPNVRLLEPLAYFPFVRLMARARVIVTDSGGIQEEAPSLGIPVLVLRRTTERPEGLAAAGNRLVGTDPEAILAALDAALNEPPAAPERRPYPNPFGDGRAAHRVARAILTRFGLRPEPLELVPAIGGGAAERPSSQVLAGADHD